MALHSAAFLLVFLPLALGVWEALRAHRRARLIGVVAASYAFYAWADVRFVPLLAVATGIAWLGGRGIATAATPRGRKAWVTAAVVASLTLLAAFKYVGFLTANLAALASLAGLGPSIPQVSWALPLGVSFYTFTVVSYVIDVYRGRTPPAADPWELMAHVALFPKLIAGPIARYEGLREPLATDRGRLTAERVADAMHFVVTGLARKVLLADTLGARVDPLFADPAGLDASLAWLAAVGYTLQIYFDFAGYSDLAVGVARLFGLPLPQNFDSPYRARSVAEFWRRWHITLSSWLRDYLYIPLGGNRRSRPRHLVNLFLTMLLGGLWHGAAWTFVAWGAWHGLLLAVHQVWQRHRRPLPSGVAVGLTFLAVTLGWVFFRACDLSTALTMLGRMAGLGGLNPAALGAHAALAGLVVVGLALVARMPNAWAWRPAPSRRAALAYALLAVASVLAAGAESPFLYMRF